MKKKILILLLGLFLISFISAEQVLWDNDTNIEVYDTWRDIDGLPLTGATCTWYVYNKDGTSNQSGTPSEFSEGVINFTVSQLSIEIYPMLINCTKGSYNGTSSKDSIKIVDELSEEYKQRLVEINQTTHNIYDLLLDDMNVTLTSILNLTNLTYEKTLELETSISVLDSSLTTFRTYLEDKWGNEDANEIIDRLKNIRSDVTYLRSRYYYTSEEEKQRLLLSIREDSRKVLDLIYGKDKWWENIYVWVFPSIFLILVVIFLLWLIKKKSKDKIEEFGGDLNEKK